MIGAWKEIIGYETSFSLAPGCWPMGNSAKELGPMDPLREALGLDRFKNTQKGKLSPMHPFS